MVLAALAVFAGCGSDTEEPSAAAPGKVADGGFPATVEHAFGTTTVPKRPERIVVVGLTEQDTSCSSATSRSPRRSGTASSPARLAVGEGGARDAKPPSSRPPTGSRSRRSPGWGPT